MNFIIRLLIIRDKKGENYDLIFIIIKWLIKIIYYKPVKITINTLSFIKFIINLMIRHYSLLNLIIINKRLFFTSKIWLVLYYFFSIK